MVSRIHKLNIDNLISILEKMKSRGNEKVDAEVNTDKNVLYFIEIKKPSPEDNSLGDLKNHV